MSNLLDALLGQHEPNIGNAAQVPVAPRQTLTANQRAVLRHLRLNGAMSDETLVDTYEARVGGCVPVPTQAPSGLRTRRHELVEMGYVVWDGTFQTTRFGRKTAVWRAS